MQYDALRLYREIRDKTAMGAAHEIAVAADMDRMRMASIVRDLLEIDRRERRIGLNWTIPWRRIWKELGLTSKALKRARGSYVYFMQSPAGGPIKIGMSIDPVSRRHGVQTGYPGELAILKTIPGGKQLERRLHRQFKSARINGEWFRPAAEILAYIAAAAAQQEMNLSDDDGACSLCNLPCLGNSTLCAVHAENHRVRARDAYRNKRPTVSATKCGKCGTEGHNIRSCEQVRTWLDS